MPQQPAKHSPKKWPHAWAHSGGGLCVGCCVWTAVLCDNSGTKDQLRPESLPLSAAAASAMGGEKMSSSPTHAPPPPPPPSCPAAPCRGSDGTSALQASSLILVARQEVLALLLKLKLSSRSLQRSWMTCSGLPHAVWPWGNSCCSVKVLLLIPVFL